MNTEPHKESDMTELAVITPSAPVGYGVMPIMDMAQIQERGQFIDELCEKILQKEVDYGTIPGTPKPTMYKPGAEKVCRVFGLSWTFEVTEKTEDWTGQEHGGEPFFFYTYRCSILDGGIPIGDCSGSCNSWEEKYRYRNANRSCPDCGCPTIRKGNAKFGGGWYCSTKEHGCGAKFKDDDPRITQQEVGKVANPDIFSQVNTIQKQAQKRAFVGAVLMATGLSARFTQDVEDMAQIQKRKEAAEAEWEPAPEPPAEKPKPKPKEKKELTLAEKREAAGAVLWERFAINSAEVESVCGQHVDEMSDDDLAALGNLIRAAMPGDKTGMLESIRLAFDPHLANMQADQSSLLDGE